MPKLWNDTIEAHRAAVRDATLDAAAALVAEHGLTGVTMSRIAEAAGVGRATLYKYFPDVDAVLFAWHERQVTQHLSHLRQIRDQPGSAAERLTAVLTAYAGMTRHSHDGAIAAALHRGAHATAAHQQLTDLIQDLISDAAGAGHVRTDVPVAELAGYCLHALTSAAGLGSESAVRRLVTVTVAGLHPPD
ncbi:TetR/AcrR family transcriptional regulator [Actinoplanes campanulatus]|uniref:TetR/AcrR family transcriptional regulator n=1 Tax=Actinoplanes campanulatus TaxID=113559 RepID=UPI001953FA64|nr:TetR/AcrR family transcriptional regulator [Actinoplanes capillaceus]